MQSPDGSGSSSRVWRLLSSRGSVLFYVGLQPDCTIADICAALSLTRRSVWGILGDLRGAGMVNVRRVGHHHRYSVNYGARVGLTLVPEGVELRHLLRFLADLTLRRLDEGERAAVQTGSADTPL